MLIIQCPWIRQSFHSNSFSVRWVLEEVGIVVMLIVQLCKLLKIFIAMNRGAWRLWMLTRLVFVHLILVIWVAQNVWDFSMLFLISSFVIMQSFQWLVPCSLLYYFLLNHHIKHLSSRSSAQIWLGIAPSMPANDGSFSRWWGRWSYSIKNRGSSRNSSCICMRVDTGISINKFHYFLTKILACHWVSEIVVKLV